MQKLIAALSLFIGLSSCLHAAITIDDFSVGPLDLTLTESLPFAESTQPGLPKTSVTGGIRDHIAILNYPQLPGSEMRFVVDTSTDTFRFTTNASVEAYRLIYGSKYSVDAVQSLNLDLSHHNLFRFDVLSSAKTAIGYLSLRSGDNGNSVKRASQVFAIPASDSQYSITIPFSLFVNRVDFSDIDYIEFQSGGANGHDFVLDGIFVVPEPSAIVVLLTCAAGSTLKRMRA